MWIEIKISFEERQLKICHSPYGECGLKYGMFIEMKRKQGGHSPYGECGLKFPLSCLGIYPPSHSPYGECGLKFAKECGAEPEYVTLHTESVD